MNKSIQIKTPCRFAVSKAGSASAEFKGQQDERGYHLCYLCSGTPENRVSPQILDVNNDTGHKLS